MDTVQALMARREEFLAYLRQQGASPAQAEDLLQTALLRGLEPWATPPPEERLVPWFYRVLHNAHIDQIRRATTAGRALERLAHEPAAEEAPLAARRVCGCTRRLLAEMKPEYAHLLERVDVDGATMEAAAAEAGITANNAYVRLHRARKALRARLERLCGSCATGGGRCRDCWCQPEEEV